jgi:FtsP/CotA-like multicopper oxidase with cupredoxin domain
MSRNQRLSFLGIAAVIAVVAIVVLTVGGGSDDTTTDDSANTSAQQTATATATPTAEDGQEESTPTPTPKPQPPLLQAGKVAKLRFDEGETVRFRVRSDKPEHVHIHGYDIMNDVDAGKTANVAFKATITGIFEVEFEDSAEQIAELRVDPK